MSNKLIYIVNYLNAHKQDSTKIPEHTRRAMVVSSIVTISPTENDNVLLLNEKFYVLKVDLCQFFDYQ